MNIDIELDEFIDLIKNPHTVQETAELVAEYFDTDDFLDGSNIDDDALGKVLSLLQNEGYINKSGLSGRKSYERLFKDIDFKDLYDCSYFIWNEQEFKCDSGHSDVIKQLVLTYLKYYDIQYCAIDEIWTNEPYEYIKDQYFDGFGGAKESSALDTLFNNFDRLKANYIRYFGEIMPINNSTTLDEFKELCDNSDYKEFSDAYHNLVDNTDFFDEAGITAVFFG